MGRDSYTGPTWATVSESFKHICAIHHVAIEIKLVPNFPITGFTGPIWCASLVVSSRGPGGAELFSVQGRLGGAGGFTSMPALLVHLVGQCGERLRDRNNRAAQQSAF